MTNAAVRGENGDILSFVIRHSDFPEALAFHLL